jgi:hypothetical protein
MIKLLILGSTGVGKTTLTKDILQWGPMQVFDADEKYEALMDSDAEFKKKFEESKSVIKKVTTPQQFLKDIQATPPHIISNLIDTYAFMTKAFADSMITMEQALDDKTDNGLYKVMGQVLDKLFTKLKSGPQNLIVTSHVVDIYRKTNLVNAGKLPSDALAMTDVKNIGGDQVFEGYGPAGVSKAHRENLGSYFDDVYYMRVDKTTNKPLVYVSLNARYKTKNRISAEQASTLIDPKGFLVTNSLSHLTPRSYKK